MSLLDPRDHYKPFNYPWAYDFYKEIRSMTWEPHEAPMMDDIKDWKFKTTEVERQFLTQLFRFFTQSDSDIARGYVDKYLPRFPQPELRMMLLAIGDQECNHMDAYSTLMDTLGISEGEYVAFQRIDVMRKKHEYMFEHETGKSISDLCVDIACFSAFGEGLQLFSSFALLLNFQRRGLLKGMTTIVEWSLKDERKHVEAMLKLFHTLVEEHPRVWTDETKKRVYDTCRTMVKLEDAFINGCFSFGEIEGVTAAEAKLYIRYIADRRLLQLGLKPNYGVKENPFPWLDWIMNAPTHTNFFEQRSTEYGKGEIEGWDTAFDFLDKVKPSSLSGMPVLHVENVVPDYLPRTHHGPLKPAYRLYTMPDCPHCTRAKQALDAAGISYEVVLVEVPADRTALREHFAWPTFPIVFRKHPENDVLIGGANALIDQL